MGGSKRKAAKPPPQLRSRTTRSRGKALNLSDPAENSQLLNDQLRAMGLYAAPTLGDGNCLFRALSDQLYGTPAYHLRLREEICNWIASHKQRYAPFVDDERGLDVHLECMRQPATYGGHLELSAFAHMMRRDVKVIQPGLVYVIEWAAGADADADTEVENAASTSSTVHPSAETVESSSSQREKRRALRERKRAEKDHERLPPPPQLSEDDDPPGPVYVAYHDWEHFSSIRNLRGPHTGLPNVVETPAPDASGSPSPVLAKKPMSKAKTKPTSKTKPEFKAKGRVASLAQAEASEPQTPSQIPLPVSRSVSPLPSRASPVPSPAPILPLDAKEALSYRSPKRTFDESSASSQDHSESSQSASKRQKSSSRPSSRTARESERSVAGNAPHGPEMLVDDADIDTPDLSNSGSSSGSESSLSSLSSSPEPSPPPVLPPSPVQPRLTRRQRKALGLPKPRAALVASATAKTKGGAGKIVIPGGKSKKFAAKPAAQGVQGSGEDEDEAEANAEWKKNGTGRVDVRGFRELKI